MTTLEALEELRVRSLYTLSARNMYTTVYSVLHRDPAKEDVISSYRNGDHFSNILPFFFLAPFFSFLFIIVFISLSVCFIVASFSTEIRFAIMLGGTR